MLTYLVACAMGVFLVVVYLYGSRRSPLQKSLSPLVRSALFLVFLAFGAGLLWHCYGALEEGQISCGRQSYRRICTQAGDAFSFGVSWLFFFAGGICTVACSIFILTRPNPEDEA
ncbi:hypothetical protein [Stenotrophomonas ginsengisoli]|uniref:hypothetical protein n=1 Tax=Stenotrophomonas ginsengisoli TaxID=336566 RepID=UPI00128F0693|nr:hypothetical protein [Stenotrophomonas ginsengisoli]